MQRVIILSVTMLLAGCGYFNSLYNANRRFADAERARARDDGTARTAYNESIEKAAVSYRKHPDSRWADDALLLIGRARFALGEDQEAIGALRRALEITHSDDVQAFAHAYLGAALARTQQLDSAMLHLDRAADLLDAQSHVGSLARLWRARAAFGRQNIDRAWADLDAAFDANGPYAVDIALEIAQRAVEHADSARFSAALSRIASLRDGDRVVEDVKVVLSNAAQRWSAREVFALGAPLGRTSWPADATDRMTIFRAQLAVEAGDTTGAIALWMRVADDVRGGTGSAARLMVARLRLATLEDPAQLEEVRSLLLPAFDEGQALQLQRGIRAAQIMIERGSSPSSALSLFAAAEYARDELLAPRLARALFLDFASIAAATPWSGKALLAAAVIDRDTDTEAAFAAHAGNVYLRAARGDPTGEELDVAEQRLAHGVAGLHAEALAAAIARDVVVGRAVSVLDSTRAAARSDSIRIVCGSLIDSLRVAGIRADSTRSACLRGDSVRVAFVLRSDTTALMDTTRARRPTATDPRRLPVVRPDTSAHSP